MNVSKKTFGTFTEGNSLCFINGMSVSKRELLEFADEIRQREQELYFDTLTSLGVKNICHLRSEALRIIENLPATTINDLPTDSGVYFVFNSQNEIVYIGKAVNLKSRWRYHRFDREVKTGQFTLKWKARDISQFRSIDHEEGFYIALLTPKYNKKFNCSF